MRAFSIGVVALSLVFAACGKKDEASEQAEPLAKPEPPAPAEPVGPADDDTTFINKLANCPSAVAGVTTSLALDGPVVQVTIATDDDDDTDAIAEIQKRAAALAEIQAAAARDPARATHDGKGGFGGALGVCPVFAGDGTMEVRQFDAGVRVRLGVADDAAAHALAAEVKRRIDALPEVLARHGHGSGEGAGGGGNVGGGGEGGHGSGTGGGRRAAE
jgi:hypothetical protein